MANDEALREHLLALLKDGGAHVDFEGAIHEMPAHLYGVRPKEDVHSAWELMEHLRLAQWDILEFTRSASHVSPAFPDGYWPESPAPPDAKAWDRSVKSFRSDFRAITALVKDESVDLFAKIPHGEGQTVLREMLLVADHNAYHIGELVMLRRVLGAWR
jgi:hypothetical protein